MHDRTNERRCTNGPMDECGNNICRNARNSSTIDIIMVYANAAGRDFPRSHSEITARARFPFVVEIPPGDPPPPLSRDSLGDQRGKYPASLYYSLSSCPPPSENTGPLFYFRATSPPPTASPRSPVITSGETATWNYPINISRVTPGVIIRKAFAAFGKRVKRQRRESGII